MAEELLINVHPFEPRVALVSHGLLNEVHLARAASYSVTGNIYLGKVERIIPGMQAAFVDIGLDAFGDGYRVPFSFSSNEDTLEAVNLVGWVNQTAVNDANTHADSPAASCVCMHIDITAIRIAMP